MDEIRKLYQMEDYNNFQKQCLAKIEEFKFKEKENWEDLREIYTLLASIDKRYQQDRLIWILYGCVQENPTKYLQAIAILKELTTINEELFIEDFAKACFTYAKTLTGNTAIYYYNMAMIAYEQNVLYSDYLTNLYKTYQALVKLYKEENDLDNLNDINERIRELKENSNYIDNFLFALGDEFDEI